MNKLPSIVGNLVNDNLIPNIKFSDVSIIESSLNDCVNKIFFFIFLNKSFDINLFLYYVFLFRIIMEFFL